MATLIFGSILALVVSVTVLSLCFLIGVKAGVFKYSHRADQPRRIVAENLSSVLGVASMPHILLPSRIMEALTAVMSDQVLASHHALYRKYRNVRLNDELGMIEYIGDVSQFLISANTASCRNLIHGSKNFVVTGAVRLKAVEQYKDKRATAEPLNYVSVETAPRNKLRIYPTNTQRGHADSREFAMAGAE